MAKIMENEERPDRAKVHTLTRIKRLLSRPRLVMGLLLIIAISIFISLANRAVHENADMIQQVLGHAVQ